MTGEAGQPNAAVLKLAFWEAIKRCVESDDSALTLRLCEDNEAGGINFGPEIPAELWEHMATAIAELRDAAGMGR